MSKDHYTGRGVSLSGEMQTAVDKRIAELHPWVKGFSAYVQRLIHLDLKLKVISDDGGVNEDAVKPQPKGRKRPFETRPGVPVGDEITPPGLECASRCAVA